MTESTADKLKDTTKTITWSIHLKFRANQRVIKSILVVEFMVVNSDLAKPH